MFEVTKDVFCVEGTSVNWVLVREGSDLTLVDGGWLGDAAKVEASIREIGHRPEDVRAVLLTHAHIDHTGALGHLWRRYGIPAYAHVSEVPHARGEYREQATPLDLVPHVWSRRGLKWVADIVRAGALKHQEIPDIHPLLQDGPLDLPGRPVPVACQGHTSGHNAYLFPGLGAVATGDALVTGHPLSAATGPQLLPSFFSHSQEQSLAALDVLGALEADILLPGHGEPWYGDLSEAAAMARRRAAGPSS